MPLWFQIFLVVQGIFVIICFYQIFRHFKRIETILSQAEEILERAENLLIESDSPAIFIKDPADGKFKRLKF